MPPTSKDLLENAHLMVSSAAQELMSRAYSILRENENAVDLIRFGHALAALEQSIIELRAVQSSFRRDGKEE